MSDAKATANCLANDMIEMGMSVVQAQFVRQLAKQLAHAERDVRYWAREALGDCDCCRKCGATIPCNGFIAESGAKGSCDGVCFCGNYGSSDD